MNTEIRYSNGMEYLWNFGMEWNGILKIWNTIRIFGQYSGILFEYWKKAILRNTRKNGNRVVFRNTEVLSGKKKEGKRTVTSFGLYFKRYHKYAMYQRNGLSKV